MPYIQYIGREVRPFRENGGRPKVWPALAEKTEVPERYSLAALVVRVDLNHLLTPPSSITPLAGILALLQVEESPP